MNAAAVPISTEKPLESVVHEWMQAKHQEDAARARRLALEDRILALHPAPEEGSTTSTLDNGFKLTLTGKLTYSCENMDELLHAVSIWPPHLQPVKTVVQLDATGCKFLRANEPEVWRSIAPFVTVKPAKTAVTVKA